MNYKTKSIILSAKDFKEFDRIYEIFSCDFGKTSILAKGVRKPTAKLSSGLEPLTCSEIFLTKGKFLDRVTGVIIYDQYLKIKKDLDRIVFIKPVFLIFRNSFLEFNSNQEEIFNLVVDFLEKMSADKINWQIMRLMRVYLFWKIICFFGNYPELFYCSCCRKKFSEEQNNFWICNSSEIYCDKCGIMENVKKMKIDQSIIKIIRLITQKKWEIIARVSLDERKIKQLEKITQLVSENVLNTPIFF